MNKTLFWAQNETPNIPNSIGINGKIFAYKPEPFLDKAVAALMNNPMTESFKKGLFKKICSKYDVPANFILVCSDDDGLLIQSVFQNVDEGGTPLTFRLWCNTTKSEIVCELLKDYAKILGRTLRDNELENISSILKEIKVEKTERRKKKLFGIFLFVSIIALFFIWKNCCTDKSYKLNKTNVQEITVGKEMQDSLTKTYR